MFCSSRHLFRSAFSSKAAVGEPSKRWRSSIAIVRDISDSFVDALSSRSAVVDLSVAREQHNIYCKTLEHLGLVVDRLPLLPDCPDACFVEDAAVVIGRKAVLLRTGHRSRRQEVESVGVALQRHGIEIVHDMRNDDNAICDGGDVLCVGDRWVFCGLSERTSRRGAEILASSFEEREVIPVAHRNFLHLKSAATALTDDAVLVHTQGTDSMVDVFRSKGLRVYMIDDSLACNVLLINNTIVAQEKVSTESRKVLEQAAKENGLELLHIDTSELAKKDAALTCCSILIDSDDSITSS